MKIVPIIIFAIAVLAQWAAPLSQIRVYEQTLREGMMIRLKCRAPDPYDPLRGRYLAVQPEQRSARVPPGMKIPSGANVYALLMTGRDGLATLDSVSLTPPESGAYIRVKAGGSHQGQVFIEWPFNRFYVNEKLAPEADRWLAENIRSAKGVIAEVRVLNGRAVLEELTFDGKPFRRILKERLGDPKN